MLHHGRVFGLYILDKRRAAGGSEESLFLQLKAFFVGYHLGSYGHLQHLIKSQFFYSGYHLSQRRVEELACDRRRHDSYNFLVLALFFGGHYLPYYTYYAGDVYRSSERTVVDAGPAVYALLIIYSGFSAGRHGYGIYLARPLARSLKVMYGAVLAGLSTSTTFHTFALIDMSMLMFVDNYGVPLAGSHASCEQDILCKGPSPHSLPPDIRRKLYLSPVRYYRCFCFLQEPALFSRLLRLCLYIYSKSEAARL